MPIEYALKVLNIFSSYQKIKITGEFFSEPGQYCKYRKTRREYFAMHHCFPSFSPPKNGVMR
jgi:hypothetical protein